MTLSKLSNRSYPSFPSLLDRFFEGDLMDWNLNNFAGSNSTLPAVNIKEDNDNYLIELAAPGMQKENFKLNYDNGRLSISSELKNEDIVKEGEKITRREFSYQSFQRSFTVPENAIDSDRIVANYKDGILFITLPKREEIKPKPAKAIEIQ